MMLAHYGAGQAQMALKRYPEAITSFTRRPRRLQRAGRPDQDRASSNERVRQDRIQALRDRIRQNQELVVPAGSRQPSAQRDLASRTPRTRSSSSSGPKARSAARRPLPPGLSLALGSAYFRSGKLEDAEREYRAAIEIQPKLGEPRNNLAVVLFLTGRAAEAQEQVRAAEKNGFKVASGLKKDIETALAAPPAKP